MKIGQMSSCEPGPTDWSDTAQTDNIWTIKIQLPGLLSQIANLAVSRYNVTAISLVPLNF